VNLASSPTAQPGSLSDRVVGQVSWDFNGAAMNEAEQRKIIRRSVLDQLTFDPASAAGIPGVGLPGRPRWGQDPSCRSRSRTCASSASPTSCTTSRSDARHGEITFRNDLLRSSIVASDANLASRTPGRSAWDRHPRDGLRPIQFDGTFTPRRVVLALTFGGDTALPTGDPTALAETVRCEPGSEGCARPVDGLPDIEVLDVRTGAWVQFEHMTQGAPTSCPMPPAGLTRQRRGPDPVRERVQDGSGSSSRSRSRGWSGERDVTARGLVKRYDRTVAVGGLDLDVAEGEIFAWWAPTGRQDHHAADPARCSSGRR